LTLTLSSRLLCIFVLCLACGCDCSFSNTCSDTSTHLNETQHLGSNVVRQIEAQDHAIDDELIAVASLSSAPNLECERLLNALNRILLPNSIDCIFHGSRSIVVYVAKRDQHAAVALIATAIDNEQLPGVSLIETANIVSRTDDDN